MTRPSPTLCSAVAIAFEGDNVPEWIQLLPAREARSADGRGPYRIPDAAALLSASLPAGAKLVLDENHSTDLAAPNGASAPARGWIVEMQSREDGIWGRVEWTGEGRRIVADKQYRGVSPVILHREDGTITHILRASLTNTPNLIGMAALHSELHTGDDTMNWKEMLLGLLKLDSGASDEEIAAALEKWKGGDSGAAQVALQSALAPIAKAAGLAENADAAAVLSGVQSLAASKGGGEAIVALQSELASVTGQLNALRDDGAKTAATAFVDAAIGAGRVGIKPLRDRYIAMHMKDAAGTEEIVNAMPVLHGTRLVGEPPKAGEPGELSDADRSVIALMGLDPDSYRQTLADQATQKEAL